MAGKALSVSRLTRSVAIIAIAVWGYRRIFETFRLEAYVDSPVALMSLCVLGLLPTTTVVAVASMGLFERVRRHGESGPFLLGFCASGLIAAVVFVFFWWLAYDSFLWAASLLAPVRISEEAIALSKPLAQKEQEWTQHRGFLLFAGCAAAPQLVMAVVGGLVFQYLGIKVQRPVARTATPERGEACGAEPVSKTSTDAFSGLFRITDAPQGRRGG